MGRSTGFGWQAWLFAGVFCGMILWELPASWVAWAVDRASAHRWVLANVQGSFWNGSAELACRYGHQFPVGHFPGRWQWAVRPVWGALAFRLQGNDPLNREPVAGWMGWKTWHLDGGRLVVPATVLVGLGPPFNTLGLAGRLELRWKGMDWDRLGNMPLSPVALQLDMTETESRLTQVRPLGEYRIRMQWGPLGGTLNVDTPKGPLMITGQGTLGPSGRLVFRGQAVAAESDKPRLAGLLGILGRQDGSVTDLQY